MLLLAACGGSKPSSTPTPFLPFLLPPAGTPIAILAPFDTSTGLYTPMNVRSAIDVPAGNTVFRWEAVEGADSYVILLQDVGDLSGVGAGDRLNVSNYAHFSVREPESSVLLELESGTSQRVMVLQVFAYSERELVGQSDAWAISILPPR